MNCLCPPDHAHSPLGCLAVGCPCRSETTKVGFAPVGLLAWLPTDADLGIGVFRNVNRYSPDITTITVDKP